MKYRSMYPDPNPMGAYGAILDERTMLSPVLPVSLAMSDSGRCIVRVRGSLPERAWLGTLMEPDLISPPRGSIYFIGNEVALGGMEEGI